MLALYYGVGKYVSDNTRKGVWGTGVIEMISEQLRRELPGLRGFGVSNIKNMRQFYESWNVVVNRQPTADDLDWNEFFSLSFTHHMEILSKTKTLDERVQQRRARVHQRLCHCRARPDSNTQSQHCCQCQVQPSRPHGLCQFRCLQDWQESVRA